MIAGYDIGSRIAQAIARDRRCWRARRDGILSPMKFRATVELNGNSHRKEWVRWVEEAKKAETRAARIGRTVEALHEGKSAR